jgi:hypothetical protein
MAEQHHQHGECAGRSGEAEQGLEEQHGSSLNRVVADALTWPKEANSLSRNSRQALWMAGPEAELKGFRARK